MSYVITSDEDARAIIDTYTNKCRNCGECSLNAEGWRCSYLYEVARRYLERKYPDDVSATLKGKE